jgi:hypothetical protein
MNSACVETFSAAVSIHEFRENARHSVLSRATTTAEEEAAEATLQKGDFRSRPVIDSRGPRLHGVKSVRLPSPLGYFGKSLSVEVHMLRFRPSEGTEREHKSA